MNANVSEGSLRRHDWELAIVVVQGRALGEHQHLHQNMEERGCRLLRKLVNVNQREVVLHT